MEKKLNIFAKQDTFDKTLSNYKNYIQKIASTICYDDYTFQELVQVGSVRLWKCYKAYDSTKNNQFKGYVGISIKQEMMRYLSSSTRTVRIPERKVLDDNYIKPIEISTSTMIGENTSIADTIEDIHSTNIDLDDIQVNQLLLLEKYLNRLKPIQVQILKLKFEEEMTFQQIADELGLPSNQSAANRFNAAILKLRRSFNVAPQ